MITEVLYDQNAEKHLQLRSYLAHHLKPTIVTNK